MELKFARKIIFFIVLYRNPSDKADSPEFLKFLSELENLCKRISEENPHTKLIAGDFNGHCQQWWWEVDSNEEGIAIDHLT